MAELFYSSPKQSERRFLETNPSDIASFTFLLFGLEPAADAEDVAIGMAKVHLADVPRHIGGRKCVTPPSRRRRSAYATRPRRPPTTDIQTPLSPSSSPSC